MGANINLEVLKIEAKDWFHRGMYHWRSIDEAEIWLDAMESTVKVSLESLGYTSQAVFQSIVALQEMEKYIKGELMGMKEYLE